MCFSEGAKNTSEPSASAYVPRSHSRSSQRWTGGELGTSSPVSLNWGGSKESVWDSQCLQASNRPSLDSSHFSYLSSEYKVNSPSKYKTTWCKESCMICSGSASVRVREPPEQHQSSNSFPWQHQSIPRFLCYTSYRVKTTPRLHREMGREKGFSGEGTDCGTRTASSDLGGRWSIVSFLFLSKLIWDPSIYWWGFHSCIHSVSYLLSPSWNQALHLVLRV